MFVRNRQSRSPRNDRADYILSGKLFCGECGTAMKGVSGHSSNGEVYFYYNCRARTATAGTSRRMSWKVW